MYLSPIRKHYGDAGLDEYKAWKASGLTSDEWTVQQAEQGGQDA